MKLTFSKIAAAAIALVAATACSSGDGADMLSLVPADAEFVAVCNSKNMMESAGISIKDNKLKLPAYFPEEISDDSDEANEFLKNSGVNTDAFVMTLPKFSDNRTIIIAKIDDMKKFKSYIDDNDFNEKDDEDGIVVYVKKVSDWSTSYIATKDNYVYFIDRVWNDDSFKPMKYFSNFIEAAKDDNYAKTTTGKYISDGNAGGIAFKLPKEAKRELKSMNVPSQLADMMDGFFAMRGNMAGNEGEIEFKMFDADGKDADMSYLKDYMDINAKINKKALKYIPENEPLVFAAAIKDVKWDEYLDMVASTMRLRGSERGVLGVASSYLEKLEGTMAIGLGVTNGAESLVAISYSTDVLDNLSFTLIVETKDGKAKGIVKDLKGILEENVPISSNSNGFSVDIPGQNATIYCQYDDKTIILANHKISDKNKNAAVDAMASSLGSMAFVLTPKDKVMKDLKTDATIKAVISGDPKNGTSTLKGEVSGKYGLIGNLLSAVFKMAESYQPIDSAWYDEHDPYGYKAWDDDNYDWLEEEVIVEEAPAEVVDWDDYDSVVAE